MNSTGILNSTSSLPTMKESKVKNVFAEAEPINSTDIPYWRLVIDQAGVTSDVTNFKYEGSGTEEDPYLVRWIPNDPRNPQLLSGFRRWSITAMVAIATLAIALVSSAGAIYWNIRRPDSVQCGLRRCSKRLGFADSAVSRGRVQTCFRQQNGA